MNRCLSLVVLLLPLVASAGCKTLKPAILFDGEGLRNDTVLVVPFSELREQRWYGESPRGEFVAESIKLWVAKNWNGRVPDADVAEEITEKARDWPQDRISSDD